MYCSKYALKKQAQNTELVFFGAGADDFLCDGFGHFNVVRRLHDILAAALGLGTQVIGVAKHLRQRNERTDLLGAKHGFHALDLAAAGVEIADDVAHVILGDVDRHLHDGL